MRLLPPLPLKEKYFRNIEREINRLFVETIFRPLLKDLTEPHIEVKNALGDALVKAVREGRVWYEDGQFKGAFNSRISRELFTMGAQYKAGTKSFHLAAPPAEVSIAQAESRSRYDALRRSILQTLDDINVDSINAISDIPDQYVQTIDWMEDDFQKSVKAISIPPKLTAAQRGIIAAEWGQNLDMYVKNWIQEDIIDLRNKVQANAFAGYRSSNIVKMIEENYGVSKRKAKFLARQETSLLMSKFREVRYRDIGANEYTWRGSMDERERHDHKILEGKVFSWDMPPVVDRKTGRRANPGEDYGCRCVAIAVIR